MKKRTKIILIVLVSILVVASIIIPTLPFMIGFNPAYGEPTLEFPMGDSMNVTKLAAYNTPDWGEPGKHHNGIDLQINGPSSILSPCYGVVNRIWYNINPYSGGGEVAMIHVSIMINYVWSVKLVFEPWANTTDFREQQLEAITVKVGTKVKPGDFIGTLLWNQEYPHLHYMVLRTLDVNPYLYSSPSAQAVFDEIALRTNSTIYYP